MSMSGERVAIIGGGISGLTTATLLQANGYSTTLFAIDHPSLDPSRSLSPPGFASLHAAASILPHSVNSPKATHWTSVSQQYFRVLTFAARCGVREQIHYEVFEEPPPATPEYLASFPGFKHLHQVDPKLDTIPRRNDVKDLFGWQLRIFFCETPQYIRFLHGVYRALGGTIAARADLPGKSELADYLNLEYLFYVNCTGHSAIKLLQDALNAGVEDHPHEPEFEPLLDPFEVKFYRGHYLKLDIRRLLTDRSGRSLSYNYTPIAQIYQGTNGRPADVYCYPRTDCWMLGGSRQEMTGPADPDDLWPRNRAPETRIFSSLDVGGDDIPVPEAIFALNDQILSNMTNGSVSLQRAIEHRPQAIRAGVGLRFVRSSPDSSVRLSCSRVKHRSEKYILHNYGHGGSGYTLSWGCAFDILRLLDRITDRRHGPAREAALPVGYEAIVELLINLTDSLQQ